MRLTLFPKQVYTHLILRLCQSMRMRGFPKKSDYMQPVYAHTFSYVESPVWKKYDVIEATFSDVLDTMAEKYPDQYAFKYTTLDYTRTYQQFRDDVDACARAFVSMGVTAGTKVAVWATNIPAWFISFWAATKIGAILVTVNTAYKVKLQITIARNACNNHTDFVHVSTNHQGFIGRKPLTEHMKIAHRIRQTIVWYTSDSKSDTSKID